MSEMINYRGRAKVQTILVVGNGFDLHHGMKTRYIDFLQFAINAFKEKNDEQDVYIQKIRALLYGNSFLLFLKNQVYKTKTWIDMETERYNFITELRKFFESKSERLPLPEGQIGFEVDKIDLTYAKLLSYLPRYFEERGGGTGFVLKPEFTTALMQIDRERIFIELQKEFNDLTEALSLYLSKIEPVSRIESEYVVDTTIQNINADYVLSFNYTDTVEKLYKIPSDNICYYHGSLKENNIVLGYENSASTEDIVFQKYYRRFIEHTGEVPWNKYYPDDDSGFQLPANIYFYGHSLDKSDKEILMRLIDDANNIMIFIRSEEDYADKILKLIILLGKEKVEEKINRDIQFIKTSDYH